jgi:F0F1-type ATP synthase delta subunit
MGQAYDTYSYLLFEHALKSNKVKEYHKFCRMLLKVFDDKNCVNYFSYNGIDPDVRKKEIKLIFDDCLPDYFVYIM